MENVYRQITTRNVSMHKNRVTKETNIKHKILELSTQHQNEKLIIVSNSRHSF